MWPANGLEAVEAVERGSYAAILMDVQMPEMDGYQATREIRRRETRGRHIPIIAMTAGAVRGDRERALEAGMDDYIAKPVRSTDLDTTLRRCLTGETQEASSSPDTPPLATGNGAAAPEEVIDLNTLDNLRSLQREGGPDVLGEFVDIFFSDAPHQIEALREAAARNDASAVEFEAHALKANCLGLGAQRMSSVCSELVELGRSGRLEEVPALLPQLEAEYDSTRTALLSELRAKDA